MQQIDITKETTHEDIEPNQVVITTGDKEAFFSRDQANKERASFQIYLTPNIVPSLTVLYLYLERLRKNYGPHGYESGHKYLVFFEEFEKLLEEVLDLNTERVKQEVVQAIYNKIEKILSETNISLII